ncbi:MAG: hypothetical protein Q8N56_02725 [bacterium]|nr:hypothetical protein [bacterium]
MIFYQKQWQFLIKSVRLDKASHAYLFSGPSGLGKKEMALEFARFLNCQNKSIKDISCGVCPSCLETAKNCHPDFLMVENIPEEEDGKEEKQIDLIKKISQWLELKPLLGRYKVVVVSQLQDFSLSAQSAFLKTLEEPRGNTVLIATSDYPELLLSTIISRVKEIKFAPLSAKQLTETMVADGTDLFLAERISYFSFGKKKNIALLEGEAAIAAKEKQMYNFISHLKSDPPLVYWFKLVKQICSKENDAVPDVIPVIEPWFNFLRFILLRRIGVIKATGFLSQLTEKAISETNSLPIRKIKNLLFALERVNYLILRTNANPRLALENAFLELL